MAYPRMVVFDLDYTLWPLWIDTHITGPLKLDKKDDERIVDRHGEEIRFYADVSSIFSELKSNNVLIGAASRTSAPELAREALRMLKLPLFKGAETRKVTSIEAFDHLEIYPGSKLTHFQRIHKATKVPFTDMLFFDDETRNREVEKLGVTFQLCPRGVNRDIFEKGLAEWRRRQTN